MRRMIDKERARALLQRNGLDVSSEQVADILAFLQRLSGQIVAQFLDEKNKLAANENKLRR